MSGQVKHQFMAKAYHGNEEEKKKRKGKRKNYTKYRLQ